MPTPLVRSSLLLMTVLMLGGPRPLIARSVMVAQDSATPEAPAPKGPAGHAETAPDVHPPDGDPARCSHTAWPGHELPRQPDGDGRIKIEGDLKQWHKVTLGLAGPFAHERDTRPNAFTDYRFTVIFEHESGTPSYVVPGYFAADGRAAQTGAESGTVWRAHLSPDKPGNWSYQISFLRGPHVALGHGGRPLAPFDGKSGTFEVSPTDKTGSDFRAKGRLQYVGGRYLRFAGNGEYFLKAGADAPETLLAYADFDGTEPGRPRGSREGEAAPTRILKTWQPHVRDWRTGDPEWRGGKGHGLVGALNYLAAKGLNSFSFLTYNAGGDGDNVWPFIAREDKFHYDCSKLDQWGVIFDHATRLGLFLHFKLQENENDDNRSGQSRQAMEIPESLDGGGLGPERKLYLRELVARFSHELALNWNLGEENTQSPDEQRAMARFMAETDPYRHPIVLHTFPDEQDRVYAPLLGSQSGLTGVSLQNRWNDAHARILHWIGASMAAGQSWVVCNDEQNPAAFGVPPDPGYHDFKGQVPGRDLTYDLNDIRKATLWGSLLAGGAGVEYYFGYRLPENDLACEDFRSRDKTWDFCRIALTFFRTNRIPFWEMTGADALTGNSPHDNRSYCFAKAGELYLVYLRDGGTVELDLQGETKQSRFSLGWFNPREGTGLQPAGEIRGGMKTKLTAPDNEDWLAVLRKE